ncbi:MAG: metallophosphoesterase [Verrucomicrobiota bacterium]
MTRRKFLAKAGGALVATGLGGYSYWEAGELGPRLLSVPIAGLPAGFNGCRIALLADLHHGWFISRAYLAGAVRLANSLQPDLIFLLGDYVDSNAAYIAPVIEELAHLHAPLGVFAVQGNRDIRVNRILTSRELARQKIPELTNAGRWIERNGSRIWICGFDDSTRGHPDVAAALALAPREAVAIAMTHNPDLTQSLDDPRVQLVCCGHTHGGQVDFPFIGRPFVPSAYGQKYALGLVQAPHTKTFVTTGVGSIFPPLRFRCPPEVALLTLVTA